VDPERLKMAHLHPLLGIVRIVPAPMDVRYGWTPDHERLEASFSNWTHPVVRWSWYAAKRYVAWVTRCYNMLANQSLGEGEFRLPTDAQWEGAARYKGRGQGWRTDAEAPFATMSGQIPPGRRTTHHTLAVEAAEALPSGIRGMFGNVTEWVSDWEGARYLVGQPVTNPIGPTKGQYRRVRGSRFSNGNPNHLRVARPGHDHPASNRLSGRSFRVVFVPRKK
jgi:formylglycine-generating enzyme required for sulfatase activity